MTDTKTNETLLAALRQAARRGPSAAELRKQRVSFIMGSLRQDSTVTRAKVNELLDEQEGRKAS